MENKHYLLPLLCLLLTLGIAVSANAQTIIRGKMTDAETKEELIGANIVIKGTAIGTVTDYEGNFELKTQEDLPLTLVFSYLGYADIEQVVNSADEDLEIRMAENVITTDVVEVTGQRISDKQKAAPLTVESMDLLAIKETAADNFYDGLGAMKGIDLTAASLGFKVINTRGFNSTSPVRSLQLIDGVDNQAPGLNFSLGNFLGSSDLDVLKVDVIQGASSAFYGPSAFNGVISMTTKNPFLQRGLSVMVKGGERNMLKTAIRWADALTNKDGNQWMAYKLNFAYLRADDWEAENYQPIDDSRVSNTNPGRWDAVNIYGDEYFSLSDLSDEANLVTPRAGLGTFYRTGYREIDLVDYDTRNTKANAAIHFRTDPTRGLESPELILSSSMGSGTTVYQGDNRFSLRDILFFQNRIEYSKRDKFFVRLYSTNENAGNSFDPYFTALRLQDAAKMPEDWSKDYTNFWRNRIYPRMLAQEFPQPMVVGTSLEFDYPGAYAWLAQNNDSLSYWHSLAADFANKNNVLINTSQNFFQPGTQRFENALDSISSLKNTEGGTRFFDESALYHAQGEYTFTTESIDEIRVGASTRLYRPYSDGTVFKDTSGERISNFEFGFYAGVQKKFTRKWTLSATMRLDKNENFDYLFTPAASVVYSPNALNYLRLSFSSGVRNPTLTDQYLNLNVGRATLLGNLDGYRNLITIESLGDYFDNGLQSSDLVYFDVDPVQPEKVKTVEIGYRTTLFDKLYLDGSYYFNIYNNFIGFNLGVDAEFSSIGLPTRLDVYRIAANSINEVTTQGFSVGLNYYFGNFYRFNGNYSWNKLNKSFDDDPIIPAFNTPEHKYNIGVSGRNVPINLGFATIKNAGFNINYKWVQGFLFEGSPQFTGFIEDYGLLDAQVSVTARSINTTFKLGASNLLDNKVFQTYGGPRIGRLAYLSVLYEFNKK